MGSDTLFTFFRDYCKMKPSTARNLSVHADSLIFALLVGSFVFFALGGLK